MKPRVLALIALLAAVTASSARAGTTLIISGHGWGHGVGMSQWGAYGFARHGWGYKRILFHYYPGTGVTQEKELTVRVLLAENAKVATIGCTRQMTVSGGRRLTWKLPAGTYGVGPRLAVPVRHLSGVRPFARGFAEFSCANAPLTLGGRPYRGSLILRRTGGTLSVINALALDDYVRGVVPSESPARWPLAELKAQAVAARSYAVAELKPSALYDLVPDTRDQVYGGIAAERPRSNQAVDKTLGQILEYDGTVARTFYSSSSGGQTESAQDAWPGGAPIPYLRSVPDPWDTYSPHHNWGPFACSADELAARLGLEGSVESVRVARNDSLRASSVWLRLSSGKAVSLSGTDVARTLGLRSAWFSIGDLTVSASAPRVAYGSYVRVVARALQTKYAVLQERIAGGPWRTVRRVRDKSVISVEPRASTAFRLRIPGASGAPVSVSVVPQLRVQALGPHLLGGEILPRTAGPVEVWRLERGAWRVVSRPRILPDGTFRTPLRLRPTVYRITAGNGAFAPALRRLVVTREMLSAITRQSG